jgi:hypothetical protein
MGEAWSPVPAVATEVAGKLEALSLEGLIRDERGVRVAPEVED